MKELDESFMEYWRKLFCSGNLPLLSARPQVFRFSFSYFSLSVGLPNGLRPRSALWEPEGRTLWVAACDGNG